MRLWREKTRERAGVCGCGERKRERGRVRSGFGERKHTREGGCAAAACELATAPIGLSALLYKRLIQTPRLFFGIAAQINTANIKFLIPELFAENLVRGRGLFARSVMRAQSASVIFTSVYAALVAIINTKMPANGELVVKRLMVRFCRRAPGCQLRPA